MAAKQIETTGWRIGSDTSADTSVQWKGERARVQLGSEACVGGRGCAGAAGGGRARRWCPVVSYLFSYWSCPCLEAHVYLYGSSKSEERTLVFFRWQMTSPRHNYRRDWSHQTEPYQCLPKQAAKKPYACYKRDPTMTRTWPQIWINHDLSLALNWFFHMHNTYTIYAMLNTHDVDVCCLYTIDFMCIPQNVKCSVIVQYVYSAEAITY